MNRNSHLLLLSIPDSDKEAEKENGYFSQALNITNLKRRESETRAPFG